MNRDKNNGRRLIACADEVFCANWHPLVRMLAGPSVRGSWQARDAVEAGHFFARRYVSQRA